MSSQPCFIGTMAPLAATGNTTKMATGSSKNKSSGDVRKLEKLMARIGLFSVVFALSSGCQLAALLYQQVNVDWAMDQARRTPCRTSPSQLNDIDSLRKVRDR